MGMVRYIFFRQENKQHMQRLRGTKLLGAFDEPFEIKRVWNN